VVRRCRRKVSGSLRRIYVEVRADQDVLDRDLAEIAAKLKDLPDAKIKLDVSPDMASVARADAAIDAALAASKPGQRVGLKFDVDSGAIASATIATRALAAEAETAATATRDAAAGTSSLWIAAQGAGGAFGFLTTRVSLFGGALGAATPVWHLLTAAAFEFSAVAVPAMIALGAAAAAAAAAATPAIEDILTHFIALSTVTNATKQDLTAVDVAFDKVAQAVAPGVLEIYGGALNAVGNSMGVFRTLAIGTTTVFDQWAAKIDLWVKSGAGGFINVIQQEGIPDLTKFGQILGNLGVAFSNLLRAMPGIANVILDVFDGFSHLLAVVTSITQNPVGRWFVEAGLAIEGFNRWGGLATTALTGLLGPISRLADLMPETTAIGAWGSAVQTAVKNAAAGRAGIEGFKAALLGIADPATLVGAGLVGGALIGIIQLMRQGKQAAGQMGAEMQQALSNVNFSTGLDQAISNVTLLTQQQDKAAASAQHYSNVAAQTWQKNSQFAFTMRQNAEMFKTQADAYHASAQQQEGDVATAGRLIGKLSQTYGVSYPEALAVANLANLRVGESFREMWQQVQNLAAGYGGLKAVMGTLGADEQAVTVATELQSSKVSQLNQAWDTFIQTVQAPSTSFLTFARNMVQFSADAGAAGASLSGLGTKAEPVAKHMTTAAIQLRTDFNSVVSSIEPMLDSLRTAALVTGDGGPLVKAIQASVVALIPLAGKSSEARDQIYALAQEADYKGPDALRNLSLWAGKVANPMGTLDKLTGQAGKALANLGVDAQNLAQVIQSTLNQTLVSQAEQLTGVSAKTLTYLQDLKQYGPNAQATQSALQAVNKAQNDANSLVAQGAAGITTLTGNVTKYGSTLTGTDAARKKFNDDAQTILNTVPSASGDIDKLAGAVQKTGDKSSQTAGARTHLLKDLEKAGIDAQTANTWVNNLTGAVDAFAKSESKIRPDYFTKLQMSATGSWSIAQKFTGPSGLAPGTAARAGMAKGGRIPGWGGGDVVPLLAEPGETVVPKEHTSLLAHIFKALGIPGFQGGGIVPDYSGSGPSGVRGLANWSISNLNAESADMISGLENAVYQAAKTAQQQAQAMGGIPGSVPNGPIQQMARALLAAMGWSGQWDAFNALVMAESGWNPSAMNPSSGAYGIPQALPASKMASAGADWRTNPQTQLRWMMSYIACMDTDTQILTREGWKTCDRVVPGDETIGYNPKTRQSEWTPITDVHVYDDAPLIRLRNKTWDVTCTPNHRWAVSRLHQIDGRRSDGHGTRLSGYSPSCRTDELVQADKITTAHDSVRLAAPASTGDGPAISEIEAELLGWILGDGHVQYLKSRTPDSKHWRTARGCKSVQINLCQSTSKPDHVQRIDDLTAEMVVNRTTRTGGKTPDGQPGAPMIYWHLSRPYSAELLKRSGYDHSDPVPFVLSISPSQRDAFMRGVFGADGHQARPGFICGKGPYPGKISYAQADGPQQDAIAVMIYLSGKRPAFHQWTRNPVTRRSGANIAETKPFIGGKAIRREDAGTARVWCPTTGLGTWTARQGRQVFLTGNSTYGSPDAAEAHEMAYHWYQHGVGGAAPGWAVVGEEGPELVHMLGGEQVMDAATSAMAGVEAGYAAGTPRGGEFCSRSEHNRVHGNLVCRRSSDGKWRWRDRTPPARHPAAHHAAATPRQRAAARAASRAALAHEESQGAWLAATFASPAGIESPAGLAQMLKDFVSIVNENYKGASAKWRDAMVTRQVKAMEGTLAKITAVDNKMAAAQSYASTTTGNLAGYADISTAALGSAYVGTARGTKFMTGPQYLQYQMSQKLTNLKAFAAVLRRLQTSKVNTGLIQQIVALGPDQGLQYANEILAGGPSLIKALSSTETQISAAETLVGQTAANAVYGLSGTGASFLAGLKAQQAQLDAVFKHEGQVLAQEAAKWFKVPKSKLPKADDGGMLMPGDAAVNMTASPELMVPAGEYTKLGEAIADAIGRKTGGAITQNFYGPAYPTPEQKSQMRLELALAVGTAQ